MPPLNADKTLIPSLAESALSRYINFIALYFAQGIPEGLLFLDYQPGWP